MFVHSACIPANLLPTVFFIVNQIMLVAKKKPQTYGYGQKHKAWITHPNPHTIHTSIHGVWIKRWVCDPSPWITQPPPPLLQPPLLPPLLLLLPLHLPPAATTATALLLLLLLLTTITSITTTTDLAEATRLNFELTSHSSQKLIIGSH